MRSLASIWSGTVSWPPASSRLPVAKARKMSPLEFSPAPPVRATPSPARWARRSHWCGSRGASVAATMMIDPPRPGPGALDAQALAPAVVGLDQDAHRPAAVGLLQHPGGGADAPLEAMADHARAPADVALRDRSRAGGLDRLDHVLRPHVHAVDVVQGPVPGLPHHRQAPGLLARRPAGQPGRDQGVAHDPDAVGVGDRDRRGEEPRL